MSELTLSNLHALLHQVIFSPSPSRDGLSADLTGVVNVGDELLEVHKSTFLLNVNNGERKTTVGKVDGLVEQNGI